MSKLLLLVCGFGLSASMCIAQRSPLKLPCPFSGDILRASDGGFAVLTSDDMKHKALHRVEISASAKQWDVKGTVIVEVLVGGDQSVLCVKPISGPMQLLAPVADAVRSWHFMGILVDGKKVAYFGRMEFRLCNILCGDAGPSMTIAERR